METSSQQNSQSALLFEALIQRNNAQIMALVGSNVREALIESPSALAHVYEVLPEHLVTQAQVVAVKQMTEQPIGEITKIDYAYIYPEETVLFSVVYKGHDGGSEVVGLWVDVQDSDAV